MSLERITAKRTWFVPGFLVWGTPAVGELDFLAVEGLGGNDRLYFGSADIGDSVQSVDFSQLTDHRGNALPTQIDSPRVIVRPRSTTSVFIVGDETDTAFKIARDPESPSSVTADLYIIEMGA